MSAGREVVECKIVSDFSLCPSDILSDLQMRRSLLLR